MFHLTRNLPRPAARRLTRLAAWLSMVLCISGVSRAQTLQTMLTNGPVSNRFNIVFLSEGYTSTQLGKFATDATNALNGLLAGLPWSDYSNYFNAFAISVASTDSGSDHPAYGLYRNTYFNSSYDASSDYLITIPPNTFDSNYNHGQGKVDALLQSRMPNCSLAVLLVNDPVPGGSDGFMKLAIVYAGSGFADVLRHEVGHVAANLGDEYTQANPGFPDIEEPNTTRQTNLALVKWTAWIPASTPIPTPATAAYDSTVGLFEGAHYHTTGWYRPKLDCTMNHPSFPDFCEVCREALVLAVYGKVRPVDSWTPLATNVSISSPQSLTFSLNLMGGEKANFLLQWHTNGVPIPGGTNATLNLGPSSLGQGISVLKAVITDETPLVRNDPGNLLNQTVTWQLNVSFPVLRLDSPQVLPDGRFVFRVGGSAPNGFVVQSGPDAVSWQDVATNSLTGGQFWFTNPSPLELPSKMFRALSLP